MCKINEPTDLVTLSGRLLSLRLTRNCVYLWSTVEFSWARRTPKANPEKNKGKPQDDALLVGAVLLVKNCLPEHYYCIDIN